MKKLRDYQKDAVSYLLKNGGGCLFLDPRLGKTLITIRYIKVSNVKRVLIICPYSAMKSWLDELSTEGLCACMLSGKKENKVRSIDSMFGCTDTSGIFILNREGFLGLPEIKNGNWDLIVIDESRCISNPKAKITQFYLAMKGGHRICLTGTPAPETEQEYYCQLAFINKMWVDGISFWAWRQRHFVPDPMGYRWFLTTKGRDRLSATLEKNTFKRSRQDVGVLEEKTYRKYHIELPDTVRRNYDELERLLITDIDGIRKSTVHAMTKFLWLRRLCGGIIDGKTVHKEKLKELKRLLDEDLAGEQVLIWSVFHEEIDFIRKEIDCRVVNGKIPPEKRLIIENDFKDGKFKYLLCQPECYKHGAKFSYVGAAIYFSSPLGLESRIQSEDRVFEVGKTGGLIIDILAKDSVDESILKALGKKKNRVDAMDEIIKSIQGRQAK